MIGMALLCRHLDVPYQILSDPFCSVRFEDRASKRDASIMLVPNNPIEASIAAICNNVTSNTTPYYVNKAACEVVDILKSHSDLEDSTLTYAICMLQGLADKINPSYDTYYRSKIMEKISYIAKGELNEH